LDSRTPIQPVVLGSEAAALAASEALRAQGLWVPAIRPPTVPAGSARLRITFSAAHETSDVDRLLEALASLPDALRRGTAP
jgi:8-amino-7-oxononanoate synthase